MNVTKIEKTLNCPILILQPVSEGDIGKIINAMSTSTASCDDGFSVRIIKACSPVSVPLTTRLVSMGIMQYHVPYRWKHACATAIYKAGDR